MYMYVVKHAKNHQSQQHALPQTDTHSPPARSTINLFNPEPTRFEYERSIALKIFWQLSVVKLFWKWQHTAPQNLHQLGMPLQPH